MKIFKNLPLIIFFLFVSGLLYGQTNRADQNLEILESNEWKRNITSFQDHLEFFKAEKKNLGLAKAENMQLAKVVETKGEWKHFRYRQYFEGLEVLNGVYILHEKSGVLRKANGNILPNINVKTIPNISIDEALLTAKNKAIETERNNRQIGASDLKIENFENSTPELVISDKNYPENTGRYTLAYRFELEFNSFPPKHDEYLIDAHSGEVISVISQVCHINVEGTVKTKHYGDRQVMIDSISENEYRLQDFTRGEGIVTESDISDDVYFENDKYFDEYNSDEDDSAAGDAHWGATEYYDWLLTTFDWNGLDNRGHELRSVIHTGNGRSYVNAFWNGRFASFGDGNCVEYGPLTTLDVVSHEFTHGLTEFSSGLVYRNESGALNESMSDMFGKALEWYQNPDDFTWEIGRAFIKSTDAEPFRNMADPWERDHPKFYKGDNWSRFGAVHTNSNVMNHWFYLLVEGKAGANEAGISFDVNPIGMDKVMDIVFAVNTGYLTPNSGYLDAYHSTVEVSVDLWGAGSDEVTSVKEAWKAVGIVVPDPYTLSKDLTVKLLNEDSIVCGYGALLPISVRIYNLSAGTFTVGTEIPVSFQLSSSGGFTISSEVTEILSLGFDFAPGDSIEYTFTERMNFEDATGFRDNIEVLVGEDFGDEYGLNDTDSKEVLVTESAGTDLSLRVSRLSTTECEPTRVRFSLYVRNEGCSVIPTGAVVPVEIDFGGEKINAEINLPLDLVPDDGYSEFITYDLVSIPSGVIPIVGTLQWDDDENSENDVSDNETRIYRQTGADYFEDFTNFDLISDPYLFIDEGYRNITQTAIYAGEEWLGFSGEDEDPSNIDPGCQNLENILEENFGFDGRAEFCVDLNGLNDPTLSFDLVMFSNPNSFQFPEEFTSVFTLDLTGNDFDPIQIYGQPNGEIITRNIPLPVGFDGRIGMEAFTMIGDETLLAEGRFSEGNVILIDNIRITNGPVSTSEAGSDQLVKVYPNPASGAVWFENTDSDLSRFEISIFNSLGARIYRITDVFGKTEWNAKGAPAGVYFYKISESGMVKESGKLILEK